MSVEKYRIHFLEVGLFTPLFEWKIFVPGDFWNDFFSIFFTKNGYDIELPVLVCMILKITLNCFFKTRQFLRRYRFFRCAEVETAP